MEEDYAPKYTYITADAPRCVIVDKPALKKGPGNLASIHVVASLSTDTMLETLIELVEASRPTFSAVLAAALPRVAELGTVPLDAHYFAWD